MLHLTYANRMEVLVAPLAARVAAARQADPFTPVTLVVPDQAVAQFIRFQLATQHGVAANLHFVFLRRWLSDVVQAADPQLRVLDSAGLTTLIHARLGPTDLLDRPALAPVKAWLAAGDGEVERQRRRLQLSIQIARLFEEYSYSRRPLIAAWPRGPQLAGTPWARAEAWQRDLWASLFDRQGVAQVDFAAASLTGDGQLDLFGSGPRFMLLPDALQTVPPEQLPLPEVVHLFGLSYVAPAFARIFARLAGACELCVYALNPCMEFWEDVDAAPLRGVEREAFARREARVDLEADADPFGLTRPGDTPALRLWARPGREYIRLLNQLSECRFAPGFVDPTADADHVLARLQRDILVRQPERPPVHDGGGPEAPDHSLRFLACPSARREVEIVADHIWRLIAQAEAAGETLRFHQIAVMVADSEREPYLTHVEAVFRERHDLPFNIIDRRLSARSRILEAIQRLIDLPFSEFNAQELLPLLTHPSIIGAVPDTDPDRWRRWIGDLNVRFGADADDLSDTYIDEDVYNWDQALRRLALGACMTGPRAGDERIFETPDGGRWVPYDTGTEALDDVSRLVELARALIADARVVRSRSMPLADWSAWLLTLVTRYVHATEPADEVALARCLRAFEQLAEADLEGEPLPFAALHDLAHDRLAALDTGRGQHQADGVVVSSLLPMRAIPFQAIFVLGLGEGQFPAGGRLDPLDLRQAKRRAGDVSPAERDRHLFLEVLLAARRHLVLSWVARDDRSGEALEPSAVVRELQYILRGHVGADALAAMTEVHPVSPADAQYFPQVYGEGDVSLIPSASPEAHRAARARALRERLAQHVVGDLPEGEALLAALSPPARHALGGLLHLPAPAPGPGEGEALEPIHLPLAALQRFLESPLQGSARYVLGLEEDEPLDAEPDEPLNVARMVRFQVLREAFWAGAGDADRTLAAYRALFERKVLEGAAPLGLFGERQRHDDRQMLSAWRANLARFGLTDLSGWQTLRVGTAQEHTHVDAVLPAIELEIPTPDGRTQPVHLNGPLLRVSADHRIAVRNLASAGVAGKHFLPGFITMVSLSALGALKGPTFGVIVNPTRETDGAALTCKYRVPPDHLARQWMTDVVHDLLYEPHDYRLPIEVVLRWRADRAERGPQARPFMPKTDKNASLHGPVRDVQRFDLPDLARAEQIVQRRLWPWFASEIPRREGPR